MQGMQGQGVGDARTEVDSAGAGRGGWRRGGSCRGG
jgi:hypothetical protein